MTISLMYLTDKGAMKCRPGTNLRPDAPPHVVRKAQDTLATHSGEMRNGLLELLQLGLQIDGA
jgi:hypothetical protein